ALRASNHARLASSTDNPETRRVSSPFQRAMREFARGRRSKLSRTILLFWPSARKLVNTSSYSAWFRFRILFKLGLREASERISRLSPGLDVDNFNILS